MKRLIAAVSFSLLAVPAFAQNGLPYDQNLVDRALPNIEFSAVETSVADERSQVASAGNTRSDVEIAVTEQAASVSNGSGLATGPWANDYHFIAPAQ